ncbi:20 kDa chaperonin, chloroplastic [Linum perenne]
MFSFIVFQYTSIKPLGDRVLVKINNKEETSAGGILIPTSAQSKPQGGEVIAVGPGSVDREDGSVKPLTVAPGNTVLYSKYAGNDFKGSDGSNYITIRASDVMAVLS